MGVSIAGWDGVDTEKDVCSPMSWDGLGALHTYNFPRSSHLVAEPPYPFLKCSLLLGPALLELSTRRSIPLAGLFGFIGFLGNE